MTSITSIGGVRSKTTEFGMWLKLSCYKFKKDCHNYVLRKPHGNCKENIYKRYTKEKENRIKAYHFKRKSTNQKGRRQQEKIKWTKQLLGRNLFKNGNSKSVTIINYFKCINFPVKRHRMTKLIFLNLIICSLQETHCRFKNTHRLKGKEGKT